MWEKEKGLLTDQDSFRIRMNGEGNKSISQVSCVYSRVSKLTAKFFFVPSFLHVVPTILLEAKRRSS